MPLIVKKVTTTVKNAAAQKVWPVLKDLIRIANAANIPVWGGAFGALTYLINSFDEVQDNKDAYVQLQIVLGTYVNTLNDFVSVLPAAYLANSNERHAILARDAIKTFDSDLQHIRTLLQAQEKQNKRNRFSQLAYRMKIKGDIEACRMQLEQSHQAFRDARSNVVAGNVTQTSMQGVVYDEWRITGAICLAPDTVGRMNPAPSILEKTHWWWDENEDFNESFVRAEVDGVDRIVKLFRGKAREKAFLNTLRFLQENKQVYYPRLTQNVSIDLACVHSSPQFQIYGYSAQANPPFLVFHSGTLVSFNSFIWTSMLDIVDKETFYGRVIRIWKYAVEIKEAAEFIVSCHRHITTNLIPIEAYLYIQRILEGAMVDASGSITMDVPNITAVPRFRTGSSGSAFTSNVQHDPQDNRAHFKGGFLNSVQEHLALTLKDVVISRPLEHALMFKPELVLSRKAFEDARVNPYQAIRCLPELRCYQPVGQPFGADEKPTKFQLGDIGLFDYRKAAVVKKPEARKIGVMDELKLCRRPHYLQHSVEPFVPTQISDGVYRFVFAAQHSEMLPEPPYGYNFFTEVPKTNVIMGSFARKAKRLADEYGVMVDDIFLVTLKSYFVKIHPSFVSQLSEPISLYFHLDEDIPRYYWTFSNTPLTSEEMIDERETMDALGVPKIADDYGTNAVLLDEWVIERYIGEQCGNEAVSDDVVPIPGGWASDW